MIPRDHITAWRTQAPWVQEFQVEQDLVLSRVLVEIFSEPTLANGLAFRGGTALHKLYLKPAVRYSEDIDLVQVDAGPAGPTMNALRNVLDSWLGQPQWKQTRGRVALIYRFESENTPPMRMRLKIEINSREHFSIFGFEKILFSVDSPWFRGSSEIVTYKLDEILATKLCALYQRKKGRDLFDLARALESAKVDSSHVVTAFMAYMEKNGDHVTRALFERNLASKLRDPQFRADIEPLLSHDCHWDIDQAARHVSEQLVALLPGMPWKGGS